MLHLPTRRKNDPEDAELAKLVAEWTTQAFPDSEVKQSFVVVVFKKKMESYKVWTHGWRFVQFTLWSTTVILGLLTSVFAGFHAGRGFTIVAGALVATVSTLTNSIHPSKQAEGYLTARLGLRDEGWDLVNSSGRYEGKDATVAYELFFGRVHAIIVDKRSSTSLGGIGA